MRRPPPAAPRARAWRLKALTDLVKLLTHSTEAWGGFWTAFIAFWVLGVPALLVHAGEVRPRKDAMAELRAIANHTASLTIAWRLCAAFRCVNAAGAGRSRSDVFVSVVAAPTPRPTELRAGMGS